MNQQLMLMPLKHPLAPFASHSALHMSQKKKGIKQLMKKTDIPLEAKGLNKGRKPKDTFHFILIY